jgi:hypothetical protein
MKNANDSVRNIEQQATSGGNTTQVGGDYRQETTVNLSLWVSIGVTLAIALGGSYLWLTADQPSAPNPQPELPAN